MKFRPALLLMSGFLFLQGNAFAEDTRPPLPLHGIEGYGGIAATYSAYLTNTATEGNIFGLPSVGAGVLGTTEGRNLGDVLDEENSNAFAVKMKWEFYN